MYILSQDKKTIKELKSIKVDKNWGGGKEAKYALTAWCGTDLSIVGIYADEKLAMLELERITDALKAGQQIYEIQ